MKVKSLSHVRLLAIPWTAAHRAAPSMGFSRQVYWSGVPLPSPMASLVTQKIKNLPAVQETHIQSLGQEDPLEKGMANHSSMLAWKIPWTENPRLQFTGLQRTGHD